jgi:hypothetical protein
MKKNYISKCFSFFAGVVDTTEKHSFANISANFRKKFEMVLMGYSGAWGTLIYEKNVMSKISCQTPNKDASNIKQKTNLDLQGHTCCTAEVCHLPYYPPCFSLPATFKDYTFVTYSECFWLLRLLQKSPHQIRIKKNALLLTCS